MVHCRLSNVIGFDDAPFEPGTRGPVKIVGAIYSGLRFDGVLMGEIEKDGVDGAEVIARLIAESKFRDHIQLIMLQGITMAGFNVVDAALLNETAGVPVLVVSRRRPDMAAIRKALLTRVAGGAQKWDRIAKMGMMEPVQHIYIQRAGVSVEQAAAVIRRFAIHSHIPEPIRTAHLIAGALSGGQSRGNP
jgi:endonuclease V-like protein UPF0215 family